MPDGASPVQTGIYGPFVGFMSAVDRDVIPPDRISGSSTNVVPDPLNGSLATRMGTVAVNDSGSAPFGFGEDHTGSNTGIASSRSRHIFEFKSTAQTDGYPTYGVVNTNEATNEGMFAFYDTNVSGYRVLGQDCTNSHYPRSGTPTIDFIMVPLKTRHSPTTASQRRDYVRATKPEQRKLLTAGTRKAVQMNDEVFFPNYSGTPMRWNKVWNPNGSGTNVNRIRPWGAYPPVGELVIADTGGVASGGNWSKSVVVAYSVMYEFFDGSFSMPLIPRAINANLPAAGSYSTQGGLNYHTVGTGSTQFTSLTISQIPVGPYGVRRVWILRTPTRTTISTGSVLLTAADISDLRITGFVPNGTTTYVDTYGDLSESGGAASGLVADPIRVRTDHVWPWRARFGFTFDERICLGYLRPNPAAIMIVPWRTGGGGALLNFSTDDSTSTVTSTPYTVSIRDDQTAGAASAVKYLVTNDAGTTVTNETKFSLATYTVLQDLVDIVNGYAGAGAGTAFRAQLIPGADGGSATSALDYTQVKCLAKCSGTTTLTAAVPGDFGAPPQELFTNVKIGMLIYDATTPGHIPTGTRVTAIAGDFKSLTMSNAGSSFPAGGVADETIYIGWDVGDSANGDLTGGCLPGDFRTYAAAYPAVLYFSETYLDTLDNERWKRTLMFTSGEPGGARQCPNYFVDSLKMTMPAAGGILQGGVALHTQTQILGVVLGSKQCFSIVNPRGGNTALDADIRLRPISGIKGCIAPDSIVAGDGWVGFLSEDGYIVTDGANFECVSRDIWNVGSATAGVGEWGYEIQQCRNGSSADSDLAQFHAFALQGTLYCNYRSSASFDYPDSQICYDYSPGLAAAGLQEVTRGPSEAYGWSAPLSNHTKSGLALRWGTMGTFSNAAGLFYLMADDSNPGSLGDGFLRQFNYASSQTDDSSTFSTLIYLKTDRCGNLLKKRASAVRMLLKKGSGSAATMTLYRERTRGSGVTVVTTETGAVTTPPKRYRRFVPVTRMNPSDLFELLVTGPAGTNLVLFQAELEFKTLNTPL